MYDKANELPSPAILNEFDPFDDFTLIPIDGEELLGDPDHSLSFEVIMDNLGDGAN